MAEERDFELVFEPKDEGGYHVYALKLPGLHTQGDSLDQAVANSREALEMYLDEPRDDD